MIAWFARNGVAANLLMFAIVISGMGTLFMGRIPVEVFPEFEINQISIDVPYRGATPEEVEESILTRIEEAITDVEGIEKIVGFASESGANVSIEVYDDYDRRDVLDDVKNRVDAISTFPVEAEKPRISLAQGWRSVISVVLYGDLSERDLKELGKQVRDDIANLPDVTAADVQGIRPYEIAVEIDEATLQRYQLTFDQVATALRASSVDVPAGTLKTDSGQVVLRTKGRAYTGRDFEDIVILTAEDGTRVKLGDIAVVDDGFDESPFLARFNGRRCVLIMVSREGSQNSITISEKVKEYMTEQEPLLPPGVGLDYWSDSSKIVKGRLDTLIDSSAKSLLLVFLVLTLFLRPSLAIWTVIGIPVCFLGSIALMPMLGVTINVMSLFGFILVLGVVVDDAIVTGENIYTKQKLGLAPQEASILGAKEVARPVIFGVLTTMLAFVPLMFGTGFHGRAQAHIALIVIPVLFFSLIESKLILPSHLSHSLRGIVKTVAGFFMPHALVHLCSRLYGNVSRFQAKIANGLEWFVRRIYKPVLRVALDYRYVTIAIFFSSFAIIIGMMKSGHVKYRGFPRVQSERATASLSMQEGTPYTVTKTQIDRIQSIAQEMQQDYRDADGSLIIRDILSAVGGQGVSSTRRRSSQGQEHLGEVSFYVTAPENRTATISTSELANEWRKRIGPILGAKELNFRAEIGRGGDPIDIELRGPSIASLTEASGKIKEHLSKYADLFDISDSVDDTNDELQLKIRPEAENFGLTEASLARQVRQAFYGEEIQRFQRGRDDIRVMLRYPEKQRKTLASLTSMRIRTPDGSEVPFTAVAEVINGKSFPRIQRIDRNRAINVRADADKEKADIPTITTSITKFLEEELLPQYPGISYSFEGEAREARENSQTTIVGGILLIFGIYTMLAIPFRSYIQPMIVMSVIPFGLIGAVLGHMIHGMSLSMLSFFGMLALAGVVVNDSLVLVDYINRRVAEGKATFTAAFEGGGARFRAIILTSFTTFAGLYPLITLKSTQAQFLIPMAVSLGYGVLFATFITLFLVPINYLILDDIKSLFRMAVSSEENQPAAEKSLT